MKKYLILLCLITYMGYQAARPLSPGNQEATNGMSVQSENPMTKAIMPPSPQAAALSRYGEYPVSLSTGVPRIDIPVYTIEIGIFSLPVSLSYHASGIKVNDVASVVGLGWVLNAGGCISRTVCDSPDWLDLSNLQVKNEAEARDRINRWDSSLLENLVNDANNYDTQSDRYSFNFNGKSGIFRFNTETGEALSLPHSPMKIERTGIPYNGGFKITDTDGTVYFFEKAEQSTPSTAFPQGYTSTWHLSRVVLPGRGNQTITFTYKNPSQSYQEYMPTQYVEAGPTVDYLNVNPSYGYYHNGFYRWEAYSHYPLLLDKITWGSYTIQFTYASDRQDKLKDRLSRIEVKHSSATTLTTTLQQSYKSARMMLDHVKVNDEKYSFKYNSLDLPGYYIYSQPASFSSSEDYWGYYNGKINRYMIPYDYCPADQGGTRHYYGDRNPNETYMKAQSLQEVTYPTGGKTVFELEANKVTHVLTANVVGGLRVRSITNKNSDGSTANVKTYVYEGRATAPVNRDMYTYSQEFIHYNPNDRVPGNTVEYFTRQVAFGQPIFPLTDMSGSPVFYSKVTEYTGTQAAHTGKTEYTFIQDAFESSCPSPGRDFIDGTRFYSKLYSCDEGTVAPLLSSKREYKYEGGSYTQLHSVVNQYQSVDMGTFCWGVRMKRKSVAVPHMGAGNCFPYRDCADYKEDIVYYGSNGIRSVRVLASSVETRYDGATPAVVTHTYQYDPTLRTLQPLKSISGTSDNGTYTVEHLFPFQKTDAVSVAMTALNLVDAVVESRESKNSTRVKTVVNTYNNFNSKYLPGSINTGTSATVEQRVSFDDYDAYGNIRSITVDGSKKVVYLWGYNNCFPIMMVEGKTFAEVTTAVGSAAAVTTLGNKAVPTIAELETIKGRLTGAQVTICLYDPLRGVTQLVKPSGEKVIFQYNAFGKLTSMQNNSGQTVESYIYNFVNQ